MPDFDVLIRGAHPHPAIGIADGRIAELAEGSAREEINADGLRVLPGVIDAHVHFNEPGRAEWEGISTGSHACAVGGTTTFFDMPLNSTPPTTDAAAFHAKRAIGERESFVDFALWGGLVPGSLDRIEELRDCGVIGLKAFMAHSGIEDFPKADTATLRAGMQRAAKAGLLVAVHAEMDHPELRHGTSVREYLVSRPIEIELEAIRIALDLAAETGCTLHVVHVSSARGVQLVAEARQRGVDVTCETCPHYLVLTDEDMERLGALAKCAPPLRSGAERLALLQQVREGKVTTIGSDHSPSPMAMKTDADFFKVWGGISGCQHLVALLFDLDLPIPQIAELTATNVADRFGLAGIKGRIEPGLDADLVLVARNFQTTVTQDTLRYRHPHSPYLGREIRGRVMRTFLRGRTVFDGASIVGAPRGRFFKRTP
jgi:allantoinase